MTVDEAKEVLARYLSNTELAQRWNREGLKKPEWEKVRAELEDVLLGEFEIRYGYRYDWDWDTTYQTTGRLFLGDGPRGSGVDLCLSVVRR